MAARPAACISHGLSHGVSHGLSHGVSHGLSHGVSHGLSHGVSHGLSHGVSGRSGDEPTNEPTSEQLATAESAAAPLAYAAAHPALADAHDSPNDSPSGSADDPLALQRLEETPPRWSAASALLDATTIWLDFLELTPRVGARVAADSFHGPTWQETAEWSVWMLVRLRPSLCDGRKRRTRQQQKGSFGEGPAAAADGSDAMTDPIARAAAATADGHMFRVCPTSSWAAAAGRTPASGASSAPGTLKTEVEVRLRLAKSHLWKELYPGLRQLSSGEWRLYWTRVERAFNRSFSPAGRKAWAEAAVANAKAAAVRAGLGSAREQEAATHAARIVSREMRAQEARQRGYSGTQPAVHNRATTGR